MATPQLSPGVLTREVDLTVGRADNVLDNIGAIAGPFSIGPVDEPVNITIEQELLNTFGKPLSTDAQYEYWLTASEYLNYGGVLKVVRCDGDSLVTANASLTGVGDASLKIKNIDDYEANHADGVASWVFAAKSPGSWANNLKVCVIDDKADQIINVGSALTAVAQVGYALTSTLTGVPSAGIGTTSNFTGYLKSVITGIGNSTVDVKIWSVVDDQGTETRVTYAQGYPTKSFTDGYTVNVLNSAGTGLGTTTLGTTADTIKDWYDEQTLEGLNQLIYWRGIAPKPTTTGYALDRSSSNDGINIVVVDNDGSISGTEVTILEKNVGLSKAFDSISAVNSPQKVFWRDYLRTYSNYLYAGDNPSDGSGTELVSPSGFESGFAGITTADGLWGQNAQGVNFNSIGNNTYSLTGGVDYSTAGGMKPTLGNIINGYRIFQNKDDHAVDFIIMGPGFDNKYDSQAKAQELISLATQRRDCIATISPHKADVVNITNADTQTQNVIEFFDPLSSSSYAVFDSGYKYMYDRFNDRYRYIPCNGDIAGLMVRTGILAYPWFSPAGQQRGIINNAIKLAFNPNKSQRDRLYPKRINSIINERGTGILLYGDKTALGYQSAFDRINVRRLFLTVEQALQKAAASLLFEINDEITRANFVNIAEPYLRDIQAKRGLYGFYVSCDSSNNTPDVIDNNELRADIFLKPTKSINYITLTFVATRTGASFADVVGTV
jgi:hypothetical protein